MKARECMRRVPAIVTPDERISAAATLMGRGSDAFVAVVRSATNPRLLGVITARDIAVRCVARHQARTCRVSDHMTPMPLHVAHPDDDIAVVSQLMDDAGVCHIPVVSDDGVLLGMLGEADVGQKGRDYRREERASRTLRAPSGQILRTD